MPVKAPVYKAAPEPLFNWSGFYIGGNLGGAWERVDWDSVSLVGLPIRTRGSGFAGGGPAGFNWQAGQAVFGVEATIDAGRLKDTVATPPLAINTFSNRVDLIGTVVGRFGWAWDRSLLYVDGGWAYAQLRTSGNNSILPDSFSQTRTEDGWTVGGGWEYAFAPNWIFGLDYKHIDLGKSNRSGTTAVGLPFTIVGIDPRIDIVTARLSYKFDWSAGTAGAKY
jgi:outer membrane immunogenic protein